MNGFYYALDIIKNQLELDNDVNVVNTGIIEDVLLKKKDIYPYAHILVNNATLNGSTWSVSYSVICMDIVDISKEQTTDIFRGQNNVQDVLNTQFVVINRVLEVLRRGENTHLYQLDGSPNCEPFEDRFEHGVAGWTVTFDLLIPNDMTVCGTDVAPVKLCPDFEYTITDADSNILYTGDILSGNSLVQLISNATVTNSLSTVLATIPAQGTIELADVDNIDSDGLTVPTPAGVAFTCTPQIVCADATYSIEDSALNVLYSGSIVSGGNLNQTITDGSIVLQDTASTIISTTSIEAQGTETVTAPDSSYNVEYLDGSPIESGSIVSGGSKLVQVANPVTCADATVENSDSTYTNTVASGGTLVLPDVTITDSDGTPITVPSVQNFVCTPIPPCADATVHNTDNSYTASVPSGGDLELVNEVITITDENDNVLQTISFPVYENQTIELSSFCPAGADADVTNFLTATAITDGTITTAITNLVSDLKTSYLWNRFLAIYPLVGGTASTHKYNLLDPRDLDVSFRTVFNGSWTHSSLGAVGDGSTAYADTNLNSLFNCTVFNETMGGYVQDNLSGCLIGSSSNPSDQILQLGGNLYASLSGGNGVTTLPADKGLYLVNRVDQTNSKAYINGVEVFDFVSGITGFGNKDLNYYFGARNDGGTASFYSTNTFSFVFVSRGFTVLELGTLNTIIQDFQTTLGRNV